MVEPHLYLYMVKLNQPGGLSRPRMGMKVDLYQKITRNDVIMMMR